MLTFLYYLFNRKLNVVLVFKHQELTTKEPYRD